MLEWIHERLDATTKLHMFESCVLVSHHVGPQVLSLVGRQHVLDDFLDDGPQEACVLEGFQVIVDCAGCRNARNVELLRILVTWRNT